ncbi:response regulator transcription factor [Streptomyces caniscabiei]|uniref:response regulator transcription factor n=1 Tax=Streptomyces TaxID=1883 RepID=UPI0029B7ABD5|nr:response regulator transcription factor [Streptomyces caniscabiei]MDX2599662.1 response regulator transcription factor [Streptomyces caniscabiei]MDX2735043.1 response regulator transcription factor [Streptomyces caniscabiei]MDX2776739.1 response regulator transcription factor [Streptomyces caniscabiei]
MRVVIAEDSVLLRTGLAKLLSDEDIEVVGEAGNADELLTLVADLDPDLCVVDVRMPPTHTDEGLRAALTIRASDPGRPILVLSQYVEARYASKLLANGSAGIGYLLKDRVADVDEFVATLHRVANGNTALDSEVVSQIFASHQRRDGGLRALTPREREVLALMAEGLSNSGLASRLFITERAVEKHIRAIFTKLDLLPDDEGNRRVLAVLQYLDSLADPHP